MRKDCTWEGSTKAEGEVFVQQVWDWSFNDENAAALNHDLSLLVH